MFKSHNRFPAYGNFKMHNFREQIRFTHIFIRACKQIEATSNDMSADAVLPQLEQLKLSIIDRNDTERLLTIDDVDIAAHNESNGMRPIDDDTNKLSVGVSFHPIQTLFQHIDPIACRHQSTARSSPHHNIHSLSISRNRRQTITRLASLAPSRIHNAASLDTNPVQHRSHDRQPTRQYHTTTIKGISFES